MNTDSGNVNTYSGKPGKVFTIGQNPCSCWVRMGVQDESESVFRLSQNTQIDSLSLPDQNDRHVLAAAIRCNADAIITFNLKDFPPEQAHKYGIDIVHPDDFILYQLEMSPALCCSVIRNQRAALKNPPINVPDFLSILQRQQLPQTVSKLAEYMAFL